MDIEQRLIAGYEAQARAYEEALGILAKVDDADDRWVQALHDALCRVAAGDLAMAGDKAAWRQSGRSPADRFREVLDRVAQQVRLLAQKIDLHVAELLARRQQLFPEIDAFARQRQMLQAYESNAFHAAARRNEA